MYKAYFGLSDNPFSITPDPRYLYLSPRHKEALAHLLYGITQSGGFIQLTGEVGTGKTTLTRALLEQLPENTDLALILNPKVSVEEFLASVCEEFKIIESGTKLSIKEYVDKLTEFLLEQYSKGLHTVVLIDEAQNLTFDVIEQVRLLTNIETAKSKLLQIILVGQPELIDHLNNQRLRQVAQRVTARYHLIPLNMAETAGYIKHRLRIAGVERPIFTPAAMRLIKLYSGGIPRLINIICDRALLGAYATNNIQVTSKIVTKAAKEVKGGGLIDFGAPIRALKNALRSRANIKTEHISDIELQVKPKEDTKAKSKVVEKGEKKKPKRVVRVKKVSSKNASSAVTVPNSPVLDDTKSENVSEVVDKTIVAENESKEIEAIENELERKQEEKIAEDNAAAAVGELEQERVTAEQEAEKAEQEKLEAERLEAERIAAEKAEQERLEAERLEAERIAAEKAEQERLEAERLEEERIAAEKAEQERLEAERLEEERLEEERIAAEKAEQERLEAERQEADRKAAEESEKHNEEEEPSEEQLEEQVEEMFSNDEADETADPKLAADVEFGELVEDFDSPEKEIEVKEEEEPVTEVENFDIYEAEEPLKEFETANGHDAEKILEEQAEIDREARKSDDGDQDYGPEELEEEIDDDIAYELKDDDFSEPANESEILNGDKEESKTAKIKAQLQEQFNNKAAKVAKAAQAGVKAGTKLAEAGAKVGKQAGAKVSAQVKNGISNLDLEGAIAKAKGLGKKEKIIAGASAATLVLVILAVIIIPGGDETPESPQAVAANAAVKPEASQPKQVQDKGKNIAVIATPANTAVRQDASAKPAEKLTGKPQNTDHKESKASPFSNMVSSLQGILGNDSEDENIQVAVSKKVENSGSKTTDNAAIINPTKQQEKVVKQQKAKKKEASVEQAKKKAVEKVEEPKKQIVKAKKPAVKKSKLEKALLNKKLDKGLKSSFRELFKLWRLDYDAAKGKTACEKSKTKSLNCFFNTGSVDKLIRFNRPVIMKFEKKKGFNYALLVKLSKTYATLDFGGEFIRFSTKDLKKVWKGKYITLWRPPKLSKMVIKPGEEGDHVRWLSMMMDMYDGQKTPRADRKIYNDTLRKRVEAFQKSYKLKVDGIVGKSTMAYITSAVAFPGVPLLKKN